MNRRNLLKALSSVVFVRPSVSSGHRIPIVVYKKIEPYKEIKGTWEQRRDRCMNCERLFYPSRVKCISLYCSQQCCDHYKNIRTPEATIYPTETFRGRINYCGYSLIDGWGTSSFESTIEDAINSLRYAIAHRLKSDVVPRIHQHRDGSRHLLV